MKIKKEISNRNLSESDIEKLTGEIEQVESGFCPRCGSDNFQDIKETELRASKYGGYEVEINTRKCRICAYNPQKDKPVNWSVRLNRFLGKYAWVKLK